VATGTIVALVLICGRAGSKAAEHFGMAMMGGFRDLAIAGKPSY